MSALPVPVAVAWLLLSLALNGLALGESRARRALAWSVALSGLAIPWMTVDVPPMRAILGLGAMFGPMRTLELSMRRSMPGPGMRVAAYFLPLDLRTLVPARPRIDARLVAHTLFHAALGAVGVAIVVHASAASEGASALRMLGGVLALYGIVDATSNAVRLVLALVGLASAPMQRHPILAESASDFWGRRWNRAVGDWLRRCCFVPITRRAGPRWGALAAFFASAVLHFVPVLVAIGWAPALACGGYFVVEALFVIGEARLRVPRWPRPLRHAWACFAVLAPSPLFVIPVLEVFGGW